jgi:hypothetical protein
MTYKYAIASAVAVGVALHAASTFTINTIWAGVWGNVFDRVMPTAGKGIVGLIGRGLLITISLVIFNETLRKFVVGMIDDEAETRLENAKTAAQRVFVENKL